MKKLLSALLICFSTTILAASPVWKISKGENIVFIGGTVHVLTASDYPLPSAFDKAYKASEILVFETDIAGTKSPRFQQQMMQNLRYSNNRTIFDTLDKQTAEALKQYLSDSTLPTGMLQSFKPGMLSTMLTVLALQKHGLMGTGVDEYYNQLGLKDNKKIGQLETLDQQLQFIEDMGAGNENKLIHYTLEDIKHLPEKMTELKQAWRTGDTRLLEQTAIKQLQDEFPTIYNDLLVKRNKAWHPKIEAMLNTPEIEFVLVGAAHLAGKQSLLARLKQSGYDIKPLK